VSLALIIAALVMTHAHALLDGEAAWVFAWLAKDGALLLAYGVAAACCRVDRPALRAILMLAAIWTGVDLAAQLDGETLQSGMLAYIALCVVFGAWMIKQALIATAPNDLVAPDRYMYALAPPMSLRAAANMLKPRTMGAYGGRAIIAGEWTYCVHRGKFKKLPTQKIDLSGYSFVDSGETINNCTSARLDAIVNTKAVMLLNDCSALNTTQRLDWLLLKRAVRSWIQRKN
jgi:hypothetical protein